MAETSIEWTATRLPDGTVLPGYTFNPWKGCQKVGPGCDHCYAEARDKRFTGGKHWGPGAPRRLTSDANWRKPLAWNAQAAKSGIRRKVFCASLADVFDNAVDPAWRARLWELIWMTPHLDWLLLTKRPGNIAGMLPSATFVHPPWGKGWSNVWLGCTVVNQAEADRDIPKLLAVPAAVRFLSVEPLLGPVDIEAFVPGSYECGVSCGYRCGSYPKVERCESCDHEHDEATLPAVSEGCVICGGDLVPVCPECDGEMVHHHSDTPHVSWIIAGGESGPHARPMHPDWARSLRDQCAAAGVPFFFKQWGEWMPFSQFADDGDWMYQQLKNPDSDASRRCKFDSLCIASDGATYSTGTAHLITSWPAIGNHPSRTGLARKNAAGESKFTGEVRFNEQWLDQPLRWRKPRRIFVCAHGDLFHESVPDEWLDRVFAVMALAPQHTFQVLTKRPERAAAYMAANRMLFIGDEMLAIAPKNLDLSTVCEAFGNCEEPNVLPLHWPLPNVWLGTSISDQASADLRIPHLLATPAAVRFVSAEPLLGPVDLMLLPRPFAFHQSPYGWHQWLPKHLHWLIVGGESGPHARPMHPDWARRPRDQCAAAGVPFFFKQWVEHEADQIGPEDRRSTSYPPGHVIFRKVGKARAGRKMDGREHNAMPGAAE